jgi:hypothetical protein
MHGDFFPEFVAPVAHTLEQFGHCHVRSGNLRSLAKLRFELKEDQVLATTTAKGAVFPSSVPLNGVNNDWVELVAEEVLIAMLDGNRVQIPD